MIFSNHNKLQGIDTRKQRGVGIIEVLVALIIISVGVLGMAGLQLTGIKHSASGFTRSKAVMLTENMATRMRINLSAVNNGQYAPFDSSSVSCSAPPAPYCQAYDGTDAERCNADELADFDLFSVVCGDLGSSGANAGLTGLMPDSSTLTIECAGGATCAVDDVYTIRVTWPAEKTASSQEDTEPRQVQMRLRP